MREKLENSGWQVREYQVSTAEDALAELERGRHVEIDLPDGAGRSIIAQQATWLWLMEHVSSRVLHVVPRRALVQQQTALARWMAPDVLPLGLDPGQMQSPLAFRGIANAHRLYVSTPGLLVNAIRRARFPRERIAQIGLIIVHEYEGMLVADKGAGARWHQDLIQLRRLLPESAQLLLLTASSPLTAVDGGSTDPLAQSFTDFVREELYPVSLHVDPQVYAEDAPIPQVRFVAVRDDFVWGASEALRWEARDVIDQIGASCGREIDEDYLLANLVGIARFHVNTLRALDASEPTEIPIDSDIRKACYQVRSILGRFSYLSEDMFQGFVLHWKRVETSIGDQKSSFDRPHLRDERQSESYQAQIEGKGFALEQVLMDRPDKSGIILARHATLAQALHEECVAMEVPAQLISADLDTGESQEVLTQFGRSSSGVLVATRDALGVGLGLPRVDYCLFYSLASAEMSTWLELSRLGRIMDCASEAIFLCYEGTPEAESAQALAQEMEHSNRGYKIEFVASF